MSPPDPRDLYELKRRLRECRLLASPLRGCSTLLALGVLHELCLDMTRFAQKNMNGSPRFPLPTRRADDKRRHTSRG